MHRSLAKISHIRTECIFIMIQFILVIRQTRTLYTHSHSPECNEFIRNKIFLENNNYLRWNQIKIMIYLIWILIYFRTRLCVRDNFIMVRHLSPRHWRKPTHDVVLALHFLALTEKKMSKKGKSKQISFKTNSSFSFHMMLICVSLTYLVAFVSNK